MHRILAILAAVLAIAGCSDEPPTAPEKVAYVDGWGRGFLMNPDGSEVQELGEVNAPEMSPDSRQIAFDRGRGIWIMNADGTGRRQLTETGYQPAFSPDGELLAFADDGAIHVMNADGTERREIYRPAAPDGEPFNAPIASQPVFAPDGKTVAFDEAGFISAMNVDGNRYRVILRDRYFNSAPSYSPDGSQIVFTSNRGGKDQSEVYVMRADGTDIRQLNPQPAGSAEFSPDGKHIMFSVLTPHVGQHGVSLYVMRADGTEVRRLTPESVTAQAPSWGGTG